MGRAIFCSMRVSQLRVLPESYNDMPSLANMERNTALLIVFFRYTCCLALACRRRAHQSLRCGACVRACARACVACRRQ